MLGISALKGYQVEALEAVCLNKRDTLVYGADCEQNSAYFEVGLIRTIIDHVTVSERPLSTASVTGQIRIGLKSARRWRYSAVRLAPTQWRGGSIRPRRSECNLEYATVVSPWSISSPRYYVMAFVVVDNVAAGYEVTVCCED